METLLCFAGSFLISSPLLIFIGKDIKSFIKEIRTNKANKANKSKKTHSNQRSQSLLIPNSENNEELNIEKKLIPEIIKLDELQIDEIKEKQDDIKGIKNDEYGFYSINILLERSSIMTWFGLLIFGYILARLIVEILNYRRDFKYIASHFQDLIDLFIRSFLIYIMGNISKRFKTKKMKIEFIIFVSYFLITYVFTFQFCPNIQLESDGIGTANIIIVILLLCIFVIIGLYIMIRNCYNSFYYFYKPKMYWFCIIIIILFNILMIIFGSTNNVNIHIHHHYWSLLLSIFCRSDNKITAVTQCFLIAVMIHGISVFGCSDLYSWKNVNTHHFDNICADFECKEYQCSLPKN